MNRHAGRRRRWSILGAAVWLAVGCSDGQDYADSCIDEQITELNVRAEPETVRLEPDGLGRFTVAVVPTFPSGFSAATPQDRVEEYALDVSGDGDFEVRFQGRSTTASAPAGRFLVQVQATRCDGVPVVGRAPVTIVPTHAPILEISYNPPFGQSLIVGTQIGVAVNAIDQDAAAPMEVWWSWGDGGSERIAAHSFREAGRLGLTHTYDRRGVFTFTVAVTDAQGDRASHRRVIFSSAEVAAAADLASGSQILSAAVYPFVVGDNAVTGVVAAADEAGLIVYRHDDDLTVASQTDVNPNQQRSARHVALDRSRRLAYIATDNDLYLYDVSDATAPRLVYPGIYRPAPQSRIDNAEINANYEKTWVCNGGRWLWVINTYDGLYLAELDHDLLDDYRAEEPEGSAPEPWTRHLRRNPHNNQVELPIVNEPSVLDVDCTRDRFAAVVRSDGVNLYDLQGFLNDGDDEPTVYDLPLPRGDRDRDDIAQRVEFETNAAVTDAVTLHVAMGDHGYARFEVRYDEAVTEIALARHFLAKWRGGDGSVSYDFVADMHRVNGDLLMSDYAFGLQDALLRWDAGRWEDFSDDVTRTLLYTNNKCAPWVVTDTSLGNNFHDIDGCWTGAAVFDFVGDHGDGSWFSGNYRGRPYLQWVDRASGELQQRYTVPEPYEQVALLGDWTWLFRDGRLDVYDAADLAAAAAAEAAPLPDHQFPFDNNVLRVGQTGDASTDVVLGTDGEVQVLVPDGQGRPVLLREFVSDVRLLDERVRSSDRMLWVLEDGANRVERYRPRGATGYELAAQSAIGGYNSIELCGDTLYAMRAVDGQRVFERLNNAGTPKEWGRLPIAALQGWTCDDEAIYMADRATADQPLVRVTAYALEGSAGTPIVAQDIDLVTGEAPTAVTLLRRGPYLVVHLRGGAHGFYVYDIEPLGEVDFVASDTNARAATSYPPRARLLADDGLRFGGVITSGRETFLRLREF